MSIQSLDEVLAGVDASEQEMVNDESEVQATDAVEADEGEEQPDEAGGGQEHDAHGALHAERQRVKRKYTDTVAEFDRKFTEATANFDKRLAERETAINQQWEQRFSQFAQQFQQPQRREPEPQQEAGDPLDSFFKDANGFVTQHASKAVESVKSEFAQYREYVSQRDAIRDHGKEKVQAAFSALDQAARAGDPDAIATVQRVKTASMDPFGDIVAWHDKTSVIRQVGSDPDAYGEKLASDPAFLAKHGLMKVPEKAAQRQPNEKRPLPSLNNVTSAADDEGDEEDAVEVFNSALRRGVNR